MIRMPSARRAAVHRLALPFLVFLSVALLILGKADGVVVSVIRNRATDAVAPALEILSRPLEAAAGFAGRVRDWVEVYRRNEALERENRRLLGWRTRALSLAAENAELRGLLKLVPDRAVSFVSARVIADSAGAYAQSLLIDAGRDQGVKRGDAVLGGRGLVGRITEVGRRTARVLLLTDLNSRLPVFIEAKGPLRAILAGDNSPRPTLRFFPAKAVIRPGDPVVTSGVGGLFPPNLPIGVVAGFEGTVPRVAPYAEFSEAAYLRVVNYGLTAELPTPVPMAARGGREGPEGGGLARR
jgi:rod shape-determining protein MreC